MYSMLLKVHLLNYTLLLILLVQILKTTILKLFSPIDSIYLTQKYLIFRQLVRENIEHY